MKYPCFMPPFMSTYTSVTFYYLFFLPILFIGQMKPTTSKVYKPTTSKVYKPMVTLT